MKLPKRASSPHSTHPDRKNRRIIHGSFRQVSHEGAGRHIRAEANEQSGSLNGLREKFPLFAYAGG